MVRVAFALTPNRDDGQPRARHYPTHCRLSRVPSTVSARLSVRGPGPELVRSSRDALHAFGLPSRVFALAGTYSLVAYLACAIVVGLIALSFAEVASRFSGTGGPYVYARDAFGVLAGFEVGWLLWLARLTDFGSLAKSAFGASAD